MVASLGLGPKYQSRRFSLALYFFIDEISEDISTIQDGLSDKVRQGLTSRRPLRVPLLQRQIGQISYTAVSF